MIQHAELALITRPEPDATILAKQLSATGVPTLIDPLLEIIFSSELIADTSNFTHILTTSANAIRALAVATETRHQFLWVVGAASAQIAQDLGFINIFKTEGGVDPLLQGLLAEKPTGSLLYLRGDVVRHDLVKLLQTQGFFVEERIAYHTRPATSLRSETLVALDTQQLKQVLFFSSRTAQIFERLCYLHGCPSACERLRALCYSEAIRATVAAGDLPWKEIMLL